MAYQEYLTPIFTSAIEIENTILRSTSEYSSGYAIWKAFNRTTANSSDCWLSSATPTVANPQSFEIDFTLRSSPVHLVSYSFQGRPYSDGASPKTWYIEVLLDTGKHGKASWRRIHAITNLSNLNDAANTPIYTFTYSNGNPLWIRKLRMVITESNSASYVSISNFKLSGYDNIVADTLPAYLVCHKWLWQVDAQKVAPDADILVGIAPITRDMTVALSPTEQGLFRFTNTLNYGDRLLFALDTKLKQLTCWHNRLDKVGTITYDFSGAAVVPVLGDIGSSGEVLPTITGQQVFTQSGEFTVPEFVSTVDILAVGGGGPGCQSIISDPRGGGSGGEVVYQTNVVLPVGVAAIPIVVGTSGQPSRFNTDLVVARAGNPGNGKQGGVGIAEDGVGAGGSGGDISIPPTNGVDGVDMSSIFGTELGDAGWFGGGGGGGPVWWRNTSGTLYTQDPGLGSEHGGGADGNTGTTPHNGQANTGGGGGGGYYYYWVNHSAVSYVAGGLGGTGLVVVKWAISNAQYTNKFKFNLGKDAHFSMDGVVREYDQLTAQGYIPYETTAFVTWFQPYIGAEAVNTLHQIIVS